MNNTWDLLSCYTVASHWKRERETESKKQQRFLGGADEVSADAWSQPIDSMSDAPSQSLITDFRTTNNIHWFK